MNEFKLILNVVLVFLLFGFQSANGARLGYDYKLIIQSPTRVQAGKFFQVNMKINNSRLSGICWMAPNESKGFRIPNNFNIRDGKASVNILPIQTGTGSMSFYCGTQKSVAWASGSIQIYIAP